MAYHKHSEIASIEKNEKIKLVTLILIHSGETLEWWSLISVSKDSHCSLSQQTQ